MCVATTREDQAPYIESAIQCERKNVKHLMQTRASLKIDSRSTSSDSNTNIFSSAVGNELTAAMVCTLLR